MELEKPLVSVIISTFNRQPYLQRSIESVLNQDFQDFELWAVDDGSTDTTWQWLNDHYTNHNQVHLVHQENRGVSAARNLGIEASHGEWIAFLDSDDEWLPQKLSRQVELLQKKTDLVWVHGEEKWYRNGQFLAQKKKHKKSGGRQFLRSIELCCISPSTVMIRRDILKELSGFNEDFPVCEDYELWLKISSHYPIGFVEEPIIHKHGGHGDQLSMKFKAMDYWRVKALLPFLKSKAISEEERQKVAETMVFKSRLLIQGYKKHGNIKNLDQVQSWLDEASTYLGTIRKS